MQLMISDLYEKYIIGYTEEARRVFMLLDKS